jgi:hypothetical protein
MLRLSESDARPIPDAPSQAALQVSASPSIRGGRRNGEGQTFNHLSNGPFGRTSESRHWRRKWFQQENVRNWRECEQRPIVDGSNLDGRRVTFSPEKVFIVSIAPAAFCLQRLCPPLPSGIGAEIWG